MQKVYKLSIGSNNETKELERAKIETLCNAFVDGFTCYETKGYWKGEAEKSMVVEILVDSQDEEEGVRREARIVQLAENIKRALKQEAVLLQKQEVSSVFI